MAAGGHRRRPPASGADGGVLWLRDGAGREASRPEPLTLERIVTAAVVELDAHGADRLTMRRLARRLEVTSTALYWHVATKEDLLDLAVDHVLGDVPVPDGELEPRPALRALLVDWRAAMLAHPWSPGLLARPLLGPNVLARTEFLQRTLTRTGLSGVDLAAATRLLRDIVIGAAVVDATWRRLEDPVVLDRARDHITGLAERYPTLSTSGFVDDSRSDDDLFRHGLDRLLDVLLP